MAVPDLFAPAGPAGKATAAPGPRTHLGRHIARTRPGLRWVVAWTVAGTVVPGIGLIAAGHRRAGAALLAAGVVTPVTIGGALWRRSAGGGGLDSLRTDPNALMISAAIALGGGALLAAVALATNRALLRRSRPGRLRRATNMLVTGALVGAILGGAWLGGTELLDRRAAAMDAGSHS